MAAENEVVGKEVEETATAAVAEATAAVEDAGMAPPAVVGQRMTDRLQTSPLTRQRSIEQLSPRERQTQ